MIFPPWKNQALFFFIIIPQFFILVLAADAKLAQIVVAAVVDIEIHIALDARKLSCIRMLPELPFALVLHFIYIIMGYPVRIVIENGRTEILLLKLIIGIDDRFHMIPILYDMQPYEHIALKILYTLVIGLMLDVEYGRKIAIRKMHLLQEVIRLFASRRFIAPEMIHATDESVVASLIEVLAEVFIQAAGTLGTLDDDKAHRTTLDHRIVELLPVYLTLIMRNINAMNLVAFGIYLIAIEGTPSETGRSDKEMIEQKNIQHYYRCSTNPPCQSGITLKNSARSTDIVSEFVRTFCEGKLSLFYSKFEEVMSELTGDEICYDFKYNSIFDKDGKVKAFIEANRDALKDYSEKYQSLLQSSKLFKQNNGKTFGTYQASELSKSVADNAFFEVSHKIILSDGETTIDSARTLTDLINDELSSILNNATVKKTFEKIDKKASANDSLRQFKEIIENHPDLVDKLLDYDNFHKDVWKGYFARFKNKADELFTAYQSAKPTLDSVLRQAAVQRIAWEKTISIFNRRFSVPFEVKIKNQTDILLNEEAAALSFDYCTQTGQKEVESKILEEVVLSKGELRAFYTLQLLFAIEKMKHDERHN